MTNTHAIRPAWTPLTIGLMVLGFVLFWPLGLAMLAYILWGDKFDDMISDLKANTKCRRRRHYGFHSDTGNVAFDDYRKAELDRLEEERRRLDEMRAEFDEYLRNLRRAKDQEEFDKFMSAFQANDGGKRSKKSSKRRSGN